MTGLTKYFVCLFALAVICSNCSGVSPVSIFNPKVIQSEARFDGKTFQNIKVTEEKMNFPTKEILTDIIFFDRDSCVFIGNKFTDKNERRRTFFKTSDGGKSWQDNEVEIPEGAGVSQIFFTNRNVGWLVLFNNGNPWEDYKRTWLMKTSDGGENWNIVKTANKTIYEEIFFTDEKNGWLIGNEYSLEPTVTVKPLVYKTSDGGENWIETSARLRNLIGIDSGKAQIGNLLAKDSQNIKVTNKYNIFESTNGGQNWHEYGADFSFLRDQNAVGNLGFIGQTNRLKVAQGGLTTEGRYVYLATETENGTWISREIKEPINLSNAVFLTEKKAFLFGRIQEGFTKEDWENKNGVIYYSEDGGQNFSKIFQKQKSGYFSEIHKLADNKFFVVGEDGLIISIEF